MRINKCKYDGFDSVSTYHVCCNPQSKEFSALKTYYCTGIENGCRLYELVDIENSLPFIPLKFYPKIF